MSTIKESRPSLHIARSPTRLADGKVYHYAYLRYSEWDPRKNRPQPKPLASLGRTDRLDTGRVKSLGGFLRDWLKKDSTLPFEALRERFEELEDSFRILCSKDFGLRWIIEQAWADLGYKEVVEELTARRKHEFRVDLAIFLMVMAQLMAPRSKRAMTRWKGVDLFFPEAEAITVEELYKAMDVLESGHEAVERKLTERLTEKGMQATTLLHDTTSQHFRIRYDDKERAEIEEERLDRGLAQREATVNRPPLRMRGKSKSKRGDLPQVVLEAVVGNHRLLLHHEVHPGNTTDSTLTSGAVEAMRELGYREVRWAGDSGTNSAKNRGALREARFDFVLGEGVSRSKVVRKVLATRGPFVRHPRSRRLSYKCVVAEAEEERKSAKESGPQRLYIIRRDDREREFGLRRIERHLKKVEAVLAKKDEDQSVKLLYHSTLKRYVKRDGRTKDSKGKPAGKVILDRKRITAERAQAGVSVIGTDVCDADPLTVDRVYRSLAKVELVFRNLKTGLRVGPVRHRSTKRIKAHFLVAIMAYNLGRWLEIKSGKTLEDLRCIFSNLRVQEVAVGEATYWETVELDGEHFDVLDALGYDPPPKRFTVDVT